MSSLEIGLVIIGAFVWAAAVGVVAAGIARNRWP
jgi:hypothetical protein